MAKTRPPKIPGKPVPVLPDEDVRRLLADCAGKDFRDRRHLAIIRLLLDTLNWRAAFFGRSGSAQSQIFCAQKLIQHSSRVREAQARV
jgi:hypothetical protein